MNDRASSSSAPSERIAHAPGAPWLRGRLFVILGTIAAVIVLIILAVILFAR